MVEGGRQVATRVTVAALQEQRAERVALMGVVVNAMDGAPPSFVLDDTTGIVLIRQFEHPSATAVGSVVNVIGWCREHEGERYIASDIVKAVDARWLDVHRRLAAAAMAASATASTTSNGTSAVKTSASGITEETITDDDDSDIMMLRAIREIDSGSGAPIDDIVKRLGSDAEGRIALMLQRGDVFEVSPGKIKVLE